jgi:hypothetical protein
MSYRFADSLWAGANAPAHSADEKGGGREETGTNYRGPGPGCVGHIFVFLGLGVFCRPYNLTLSDQALRVSFTYVV